MAEEVDGNIVRARRPGCLLQDNVFYKQQGNRPLKSQQYGHLSKTYLMIAPVEPTLLQNISAQIPQMRWS